MTSIAITRGTARLLRPVWFFLTMTLLGACAGNRTIPVVGAVPQLGVIADCQYADQPTRGVRHYRSSVKKLSACIDTFNRLDLSHVFHLGDFIDEHGWESMNKVLPLMDELRAPHTFVLGNHDFTFPEAEKRQVPRILGLQRRYFTRTMDTWKFIILDGNDVSLYAWPGNSAEHQSAQALYEKRYNGQPTYNGALSNKQMQWLKKELDKAERKAERVILLCHFPLLPEDNHVLWNAREVLELITPYSCVKAWMNGHNHAGAYVQHEGIHFVTFKGMVDTPDNAFAGLQLFPDRIVIDGHGREPDRVLYVE